MDDIQDWQEDDDIQVDNLPEKINFSQVVEALLDVNNPVAPRYLYRLSDLDGEDYRQLEQIWFKIPIWRRQALMEDLQMLCEKDFLLSFESVGRLALEDVEPRVRFAAINTLIENECEAADLADIYMDLMENDPDADVRTISTQALGHYVYLAEIETLPVQMIRELEDRLIATIQGEDNLQVRCAALESLGFSGRDDVLLLIENAMNSPEQSWRVSALLAMGRSANDYWNPQVINSLQATHPILRAEAARAAGELMIEEAKPNLLDLVDDADEDVSMAALWALSQIGGKSVRKLLKARLHAAEDDEEISFLESALENLDFMESGEDLSLLDVEEVAWDDLYLHRDELDEFDEDDDLDDNDIREDLGDGPYDDDDLDEDSFDSLLKR